MPNMGITHLKLVINKSTFINFRKIRNGGRQVFGRSSVRWRQKSSYGALLQIKSLLGTISNKDNLQDLAFDVSLDVEEETIEGSKNSINLERVYKAMEGS